MSTRGFVLVAMAACVSVAGCADVELDPAGASVCVFEQGTRPSFDSLRGHEDATTTLAPGVPLTVSVAFQDCFPGDAESESHCDVEVDGRTLRVSASASYTPEVGPNSNGSCGMITTFCDTPALDAGQWTLLFEPTDRHMPLTIPSEALSVPLPCSR